MKRLSAFFLSLLLCLSLTACGGTGNKTYDYILSLLEQGNYDMAIHVIEGLRDGKLTEENGSGDSSSGENGTDQYYELEPNCNGSDWMFHMDLENRGDSVLTLEELIIQDWLNDQPTGEPFRFTSGNLPMGQVVLEPGQGTGWDDGHPVVDHFDRREYLHLFRSDKGEIVRISYMFNMKNVRGDGSAPDQQPGGDWVFPILLENNSDTPWTLQSLDITDLRNGEVLGTMIFQGEDMNRIFPDGVTLQPGQQMNWTDGHPAVSDWNGREYRFHFRDGKGEIQIQSFRFEELDKINQPVDYSQDGGQDLKTLRHSADFQVEVYPGVSWVPAAALGRSRYSNMEICSMLGDFPEEKQGKIKTLYEALQLYQVGNFAPSDDNVRMFENGVNWEHHKPGYHAVRTNTGCCATDSNWLRYILDGDYDEVGYIATSQRDGSGHIYNYILQNGWYYIIDLTHYYAASPMLTAKETGDLADYHASDYIPGNIHKVQRIEDYVNYVQDRFSDPPGLMFMYTAENCLAVDGAPGQNGVQIIYEKAAGVDIQVIFDDGTDQLTFARADAPKTLPDWSQLP